MSDIKSQLSTERQHVASKACKHLTFILLVSPPFILFQIPPHQTTFMDFPNSVPLSCFFLILEWNDLCPFWFLSKSFSFFESYLVATAFVELLSTFPNWPRKLKLITLSPILFVSPMIAFKTLTTLYIRVVLGVYLSPLRDSKFPKSNCFSHH